MSFQIIVGDNAVFRTLLPDLFEFGENVDEYTCVGNVDP